MKRKARKPSNRPNRQPSGVVTTLVEDPVPHVLVQVTGVMDEKSVTSIFKRAGEKLAELTPKRVLVDLRECRVALSISDMNGLVKMIAAAFAGTVERLAVVLQARDILPEKFFEPALTSRGLPTLATADYAEGIYWLSSRLRPGY
jgi:hypothetical protein